jgi:hypothetical protein
MLLALLGIAVSCLIPASNGEIGGSGSGQGVCGVQRHNSAQSNSVHGQIPMAFAVQKPFGQANNRGSVYSVQGRLHGTADRPGLARGGYLRIRMEDNNKPGSMSSGVFAEWRRRAEAARSALLSDPGNSTKRKFNISTNAQKSMCTRSMEQHIHVGMYPLRLWGMFCGCFIGV